MLNNVCVTCGSDFKPFADSKGKTRQLCCSKACKKVYKRTYVKNYRKNQPEKITEKKCLQCKKVFTQIGNTFRLCSKKCQVERQRFNAAEWGKLHREETNTKIRNRRANLKENNPKEYVRLKNKRNEYERTRLQNNPILRQRIRDRARGKDYTRVHLRRQRAAVKILVGLFGKEHVNELLRNV